jgi:hypothetical protein
MLHQMCGGPDGQARFPSGSGLETPLCLSVRDRCKMPVAAPSERSVRHQWAGPSEPREEA